MNKFFNILVLLFAATIMGFTIYGLAQTKTQTKIKSKTISTPTSNGIVVLELFTSQGCSSCPPADEVLAKYAKENNPNIIPLAFHVDYWNYIGWKDPFSKAAYTQRQHDYAEIFNSRNVYTPQVIINGKQELVGSNESKIDAIVSSESSKSNKTSIKINSSELLGNQIAVKLNISDLDTASKVNFALVKMKEFTKIKRGENNGLEQTSYNIVYDFKTVAITNSNDITTTLNFQNDWKATDFIIVAYVQNKTTGVITTATKTSIN